MLDIADSSTRAYGTGWRKYIGFCLIHQLDPLYHGLPWPQVFECFLLYCVCDAHLKIQPDTANNYVSHVIKMVERRKQDFVIRIGARSPLYQGVLAAFLRAHAAKIPLRLRARVPFTVPFVLWCNHYITHHYPEPLFAALLRAALAAGHAFSLRPGEYLLSSHRYAPNRILQAETTYGWFDGKPYAATAMNTWPTGNPTHITSVLDVRKNSTDQGGPVAVAANPYRAHNAQAFCCVHLITLYLRLANLQPGSELFSYRGEHLGTKEISTIMKACAVHHDLDPDRVVPACLRKGVLTQMDLNTPQIQRQLQGGWRSTAGETNYWCRLLQVADANQAAVHNAGTATIEVIRNIFSATHDIHA